MLKTFNHHVVICYTSFSPLVQAFRMNCCVVRLVLQGKKHQLTISTSGQVAMPLCRFAFVFPSPSAAAAAKPVALTVSFEAMPLFAELCCIQRSGLKAVGVRIKGAGYECAIRKERRN
jgi:hypothetical protein